MKKPITLAASVSLLFMLLTFAGLAQGEWVKVTPPDGSFSFLMPVRPAEQHTKGKHYEYPSETLSYSSNLQSGGNLFIAARTKYHPDAKISVRSELQANADSFSKRLSGKIASQTFFTWTGMGTQALEALEVLTETKHGTFRQFYIMDGNDVYAFIAGPVKASNTDQINRFLDSIAISKR
jgi:hypothetical protein